MKYQVTLFCKSGKYKPVSAIVTVDENTTDKDIRIKGMQKICVKRCWTGADLKKYDYSLIKMRKVEE